MYDAGAAINETSSKITRTKFKIMYAILENLASDFENQMTVIIKYQCKGLPGVDVVDEENLRAAFEEKYIGCKIFAEEYLPETINEASLNKTFFEQKPEVTHSTYCPVEKLTIPKFEGDPKDYTSFRNMFDKLIGESNMPAVLKFGYLKSCLVGEPLRLVGNLMLTENNYGLAIAQLTARYSNRRIIAGNHIEELCKASKAFFGDGASIRKLLNIIIESTGALQNLSYAVDQWDPILLHLLEKKLDQHLRSQ